MKQELELKFKKMFIELKEALENAKTPEERIKAERNLDAGNFVYNIYLEHEDIMEKLS